MTEILLILLLVATTTVAEDHETSVIACDDHNFDVRKIASARFQKIDKLQLIKHLGRGTGLEVAHIEHIRNLIEDAYSREIEAMHSWQKNHLWNCQAA